MVRKAKQGGVGFLLHVQKAVNGLDVRPVDCKEEACREEMAIAARSGIKGRECRHLMEMNNAYYPEEFILNEQNLAELCANGKYKVLTQDTSEKCVKLKHGCAFVNAPAVVSWEECNFMHMSVDGKYLHLPVRSQYIVSYNRTSGRMDCRCRGNKFRTKNENCNISADISAAPLVVENDSSEDVTVYPPLSPDTLKKMMKYLFAEKKIPFASLQSLKKHQYLISQDHISQLKRFAIAATNH